MTQKASISVSEAIRLALNELDQPIAKNALIDRVLELRPSSAKTARGSINNALRWDMREEAIILEDGKIIPLRLAMQNARFRIPLSSEMMQSGKLPITPAFFPFILHFSDPHNPPASSESLTLRDVKGEAIPVSPLLKDRKVTALDLSMWLIASDASPSDSILVTIDDWEKQHYTFILETAIEKKSDLVEHQNVILAEKIYQLVGQQDMDHAWTTETIRTAYAHLGDAVREYPGNHWTQVIEADGRVSHGDYRILFLARYMDGSEHEPDGYEGEAEIQAPDSTKGELIYVFKASLPYQKKIWRRLELYGKATLGDFDALMHTAFNRDYDHLSEFRIKPKDRGKRARWEGFGPHIPFEGAAADEIQITQLGLDVGDMLNYVYDFGDWIEHDIILEGIKPPEPEADYPRIADQNKPRYKNCMSCKQRGIETRAEWICIWCSNNKQRDILLCDGCVGAEHEEHYVEEILY